jgi:hypothetical protein
VQIAQAYAAVGLRESPMSIKEAHIASEYLADRTSPYYQKGDDLELNAGAKGLVEDLFKAAAGGEVPADPQASAQPDTSTLPVEVQEQARTLMADPAYWSKADPRYATVHRQVETLLSSVTRPPAPGQARPQAPLRDPKAEAAELMRSPAYWDASKPDSPAVRAKVSELLAQAYPEPIGGGEGEPSHG